MTAPKPAMLLVCNKQVELLESLRFGLRQVGYSCEVVEQTAEFDISVVMGRAPALLVVVIDALKRRRSCSIGRARQPLAMPRDVMRGATQPSATRESD